MKKKSGRFLVMMALMLLGSLFFSMAALAAGPRGALTDVSDARITGWVWDEEHGTTTVPVELRIYKDGSRDAAKVVTVQAGEYNGDVQKLIGDGNHGFSYSADWKALGGSAYQIEAYAVSEKSKAQLFSTMDYKPQAAAPKEIKKKPKGTEAPPKEIGPGIPKKAPSPEPAKALEDASVSGYKKGKSLGIFKTTAYSPCKKCSAGKGLTYSGTVPKADHTISADLSVLPMGTKVMIGDTVYTVEDIGSSVKGNFIDIFFNTHQEAVNYGMQKKEVFSVVAE